MKRMLALTAAMMLLLTACQSGKKAPTTTTVTGTNLTGVSGSLPVVPTTTTTTEGDVQIQRTTKLSGNGLSYTLYDSESEEKVKHAVVTGRSLSSSALLIPEKIDGNAVNRINTRAFENDEKLEKVQLSDGMVCIGTRAFDGCTKLSSINFPSSVTAILDYAFRDCSSLKDITIPETVTLIKPDAFSGCKDLTIHCAAGSAAEEMAKTAKIHYEIVE